MVGSSSCEAWFNGEYYINYRRNSGCFCQIRLWNHQERGTFFFIFGVFQNTLKINWVSNFQSKIEGCSLKRVGQLSFGISYLTKCVGIPSRVFLLVTVGQYNILYSPCIFHKNAILRMGNIVHTLLKSSTKSSGGILLVDFLNNITLVMMV